MLNKRILKHNLSEMGYLELIKFIQKEFPTNGQDYYLQIRKYQILKSLGHSDLSIAIARMEQIKAAYDSTKTWGIGSLIVATSFVGFQVFFGINISKIAEGNQLNALLYVLFTMLVCLWIFRGIRRDKGKSIAATYFKELLEQVKSEKDK